MANRGAVASGHELTSRAARFAIEEGGGAADAAIAAAWMACVVEPVLTSPGGGGFAMLAEAGERVELCDFFAHTPRRHATGVGGEDIGCDFGDTVQTFVIGHAATATPGFVPGLFALHQRAARLPMNRLLAPAIETARSGWEITGFQAYLAQVVLAILAHDEETAATYLVDGRPPPPGARMSNPRLADFLERLADGGIDSYVNDIWPRFLAQQQDHGHLREDDFAHYRPMWRQPLLLEEAGAQVFLNPPPAASGALIGLALDDLDARPPSAPNLARALDAADTARKATGHDLAALIAQFGPPSWRGTTHISVIDGHGNACAITISNGEGNGHVVPGCGFMLNNMLGETDVNPAGLDGWPPDTRLSSMMAPTITRHDNGSLHALGTGGSNRIRSAMFAVIARLLRGNMSLRQAVEAPRLHVEDGFLDFEPGLPEEEAGQLRALFPQHRLWQAPNLFFGGVHGASLAPGGRLDAFGDPRRDGAAEIIP